MCQTLRNTITISRRYFPVLEKYYVTHRVEIREEAQGRGTIDPEGQSQRL